VADSIVSSGLWDAGYVYVNIDDCWMTGERDATTRRLVPSPDKFPSGMAALAAYLHQRRLKFGIYSSAGKKTCEGLPASYGYEEEDAM
jgi:alpha-galactosidase